MTSDDAAHVIPPPVIEKVTDVLPGFAANRVLQRGGKAWVCSGVLDGRPAVVKPRTDAAPYWARKFGLEIRA